MKFTNIFSRFLTIFGLLLILSVSGWGACGTSNGSWTPSSTATTGSVTTTAEYYTISVVAAENLNISVQNTYSGGSTRTLTATLYPDNGLCTTTSLWNTTIVKNTTQPSGNISVTAGTYTLKLVSSSSNSTGYSLTGLFTPPPAVTATTMSVNENAAVGTVVGTVYATNSPTSFILTNTNGTAQSLFDISASGQITVHSGAVLDYETTPSYTLKATATNSAGSGSANITINLNNITGPTITSAQTFSIVSGSANGTFIGSLAVTIPTPLPFGNTITSYTSSDSAFAISNAGAITVADSAGLSVGTHTVTVITTNAEGTDSKTITITVTAPSANLALTNTDSPDPVITDTTLTYTLGVTNNGPQTATSLNLTDTLPAGVTYQSATGIGWTCSQASGMVTCTNPSLANGANSSVTVTVLAPSSAGSITNTATVTSAVTDPTLANNTNITQTTTVNTPNADLAIVKTVLASPVMVGNQIQYTLNITNNGPSNTDLNMTDVLDPNLTYVNVYDDAHEWICTYTSATRTISCQHPNLLVNGAISSITILVTAPNSAMTISNTASIIGRLPDLNMGNNTSSVSVSVVASSFTNSNPRNFTLQKQYNINGNMQIIGNSIMRDASTHACAASGIRNNDITVEYVDTDTNTTTFNSTTANITLPTGTTSNDIVWAGLYWQGYYGNGSTDTIKTNAKSVYLKVPGGAYTKIQSDTAKFNWVYFDDAKIRWYYQGGQDVTSYVKSGLGGTYTVANIYSQTGGSINGGGFGAWSLVVLYKDNTATLKNMSVYDGYMGISSSDAGRTGVYATTTIPLSGFFTPTIGNVNSEFLTFVGEGDTSATGDYGSLSNNLVGDVKLKNALNPIDDLFNSTISNNGVAVTTENPSCLSDNYIGIDIDAFDVGSTAGSTTQGQIILNGQTTTNVKLSSSGDGYFPGLFAFSTELYVPDVCYLEDVTFNSLPISGTNIPKQNDNVTYEISITNKNPEQAKGVFIEKVFDKPHEISYVNNSMSIDGISKSDGSDDDTAEYSSGINTSKFLLGSGATWYQGGSLAQNAITKFQYQAKIGDQNASENTYLVSYRNDLLHISFTGIPIRKCTYFNNSFSVYVPIIGVYNTVHNSAVNINTDTDPLEPSNVKNALYTQVVNQQFSVDLLSLNTDNITPVNSSKDVNLSIVELPSDGNCNNATSLQTITPTVALTGLKLKTIDITPTKASKNAVFKMVTNTVSLCSRDRFTIRPAGFSMDTNVTSPLIGNKQYILTATANQSGSTSASTGYNQTIDNTTSKNTTTQLVLPSGCGLSNPVQNISTALPFSDGAVSAIIVYPNVGDVNLTINDSDWTFIDSNNSKGDCIVNSTSNTPVNGKVGCLINGKKTLNFIPQAFNTSLAIANNSAGFTYISKDSNVSAPLTINTTAILNGGGTATNYTKNCFAKDINTTISLMNNQTLSWGTSQSRVKFFDDLNTTSRLRSQTGSQAIFSSSEGNFTNGATALTFKVNFDRNVSIPDNPFNIAKNDFNITSIIDTSGTTGNDFSRTANMNATFVYGRTHAPRYRYSGSSGPAQIYYETYCDKDGNKTMLPSGSIGSSDSVGWYLNPQHNVSTDGNITTITDKNGLHVSHSTPTNISGGLTTTLTYDQAKGYPYKTTMQVTPSSWLIYDQYNASETTNDFEVEFYGSSNNWTGKTPAGVNQTTTDSKVAPVTSKRILW